MVPLHGLLSVLIRRSINLAAKSIASLWLHYIRYDNVTPYSHVASWVLSVYRFIKFCIQRVIHKGYPAAKKSNPRTTENTR